MNRAEALEILGLPDGFSHEELVKAFKRKAFELHPDRSKSPTAHQDFIRLQQAAEFLEKPIEAELEEEHIGFERPWRHSYYTPLDQYDELEKWEYYTNPEIQREYEKDFFAEQEYSREEWERNEEMAWDADLRNSQDNSYAIQDELPRDPELLLEAFGRGLDEQLEILSLNKEEIDIERYTKEKWLKKEIDGAIYNEILDDFPDYIKRLLEKRFDKRIDVHDYEPMRSATVYNKLSVDDFMDLYEKGHLSAVDVNSRDDALEIYSKFKDKIFSDIASNRVYFKTIIYFMPKEVLLAFNEDLEKYAPEEQIEKLRKIINRELEKRNKK